MGRERRVLTPERSAVHRWGSELRALRDTRRLSLAALGGMVRYDASYLARLERGDQVATLAVAEACDRVLGAEGELIRLWHIADHEHRRKTGEADNPSADAVGRMSGDHAIDDDEQQLVRVMPLHAITATYGEQGLRARFAAETARLGAASRQQIGEALQLAGQLHAADRRQSEPSVNHLLRVALRILSGSHYGVDDTDVICAALLHDAVEDHAGDLAADGRPGAIAALAADFGPRIAGLVDAVTKPDYLPGLNHDEQYRAHVAATLAGNPWARVLKISAFVDNGVGLIHTRGPRAARLAGKYAPLVPLLADLTARPDTPLSSKAKARILSQLCAAQERFAAIALRQSSP